jgi:hypothetical protein
MYNTCSFIVKKLNPPFVYAVSSALYYYILYKCTVLNALKLSILSQSDASSHSVVRHRLHRVIVCL